MEESRLKPMANGYDEKLFNRIYKETEPLRKSLTAGIDARRFRLTYEDVLSFFDIKFIFVFNKHHDEPPEKIKAYIINALKNFKCRILRHAYTLKHSQSISSLDELLTMGSDIPSEETQTRDYYVEKMMSFMKAHLSDNAYCLLEVQLNPPPYILKRINVCKDKPLQKIPDKLLLKYFGLGYNDKSIKYLTKLKKEIRSAVSFAKASQLN